MSAALSDEQFAFARAVSRGLRAMLEEKEGEVRRRCAEQFEETGGAVRELPLCVGGMQVGKVSASQKAATEVYDQGALAAWLSAAGRTELRAELDVDALRRSPDAWDEVLDVVARACPGALAVSERVPDDWATRADYAQGPDGSVVDAATGEVVPGVRRAARVSTRILGCEPEKVRAVLAAGASVDQSFLLGAGEVA